MGCLCHGGPKCQRRSREQRKRSNFSEQQRQRSRKKTVVTIVVLVRLRVHQRMRRKRRDSSGSSACEHQWQRSQCKKCSGSSFCASTQRNRCLDCRKVKPHKIMRYCIYYSTKLASSFPQGKNPEMTCTTVVPASKGHLGGASP